MGDQDYQASPTRAHIDRYWVWGVIPPGAPRHWSVWQVRDSHQGDSVVATYPNRQRAQVAANTLNKEERRKGAPPGVILPEHLKWKLIAAAMVLVAVFAIAIAANVSPQYAPLPPQCRLTLSDHSITYQPC